MVVAFFKKIHRFMCLFPCLLQQVSLILKLYLWVWFKITSLQGLLWFIILYFCKEVQKDSRLIQQVWHNWESAWFSDYKCITLSIFNILSWLFLLWVFIIIYNNFSSHENIQLCKKNHQKLKGDSSHFDTLWARVCWLLRTITFSFFEIFDWLQIHDYF